MKVYLEASGRVGQVLGLVLDGDVVYERQVGDVNVTESPFSEELDL